MREITLFVASLAGAAIMTALAILLRPESPIWKFILWGGIAVFVACASVLLIDYFRHGGRHILLAGMALGIALLVGCSIAFFSQLGFGAVHNMDSYTINAKEIYSQERTLPDGQYVEWLIPIHFTKSCLQCRIKYKVKKSIDDQSKYAEFSSLGEKSEDFLAGESRDIGIISIPQDRELRPSFGLAHIKLPEREQAYVPSDNIIEYSVVKSDAPDAPAKVYRFPLKIIEQSGNQPPQAKIGAVEIVIPRK